MMHGPMNIYTYVYIYIYKICTKLLLHINKDIGTKVINDTLKENIKPGTQLLLSECQCGKNVENISLFFHPNFDKFSSQ